MPPKRLPMLLKYNFQPFSGIIFRKTLYVKFTNINILLGFLKKNAILKKIDISKIHLKCF